MKRLLQYLPLHFVVFGILGICFQFFTQFWEFGFLKLFLLIAFLALFLLFKNKVLSAFTTCILFFLIGVSSVYVSDDRNYKNYYDNVYKDNSSVILQVCKILKPGNYYQKYHAKVLQVNKQFTRGEILINILKDSLLKPLDVDDRILIKPTFKKLIPPLNPHQFNYQNYLAKQGIHHQVFTDKNQFLSQKNRHTSILGWSAQLRNTIQQSLAKYYFEDDELAVIYALLLGQRQRISKSLLEDYQNAGAIHILAVSGLHVGIILVLLSFVFKPIEKFKNGKIIKTFIIITLLWIFAFVAGLSASVVRAVTMFSFVAIGLSFKQKGTVEFSFVTSLFLLLLVKPMFLFDVGFQLSYLAVFGILWTQPKLYAIYKPKTKILDFFWKLTTVSIAAQVGILPLSIFYFQQIPGLFLASNLIIIPFLGAILVGGILVILGGLLNILPQFIADFYGTVISLMNSFVGYIAKQETFLFTEIKLSILMLFLWYIAIFSGVYFLIYSASKRLLVFLMAVVFVQSLFLYEKYQFTHKKEFIVFHKSRYTLIGHREGTQLYVQHNLDSLTFSKTRALKSYQISEGIKDLKTTNFKNLMFFKHKQVLVIDSLGVFDLKQLKNPIIILQHSPKINLKRVLTKIKPTQIIADGSNYKSDVNRWKKICLEFQIPFHYTGQKGAFILKE